jgi:16S rRNA (uracil1498-N3)-methyltransferase
VLRVKEGEYIALSDPEKKEELIARVEKINHSEVMGEIVERRAVDHESRVVLYCAVLKKANFELVAQKATEIGVAGIVPVITGRTVKLDVKLERLNKIAREAAEQSGRLAPPIISPPMDFTEAIESVSSAHALWCDQGSGDSILSVQLPRSGGIAIFIGPEGGWSERERELAGERNMTKVSLGALTLRAETAAIVAAYAVCAQLT